jgi:hypothetical protein
VRMLKRALAWRSCEGLRAERDSHAKRTLHGVYLYIGPGLWQVRMTDDRDETRQCGVGPRRGFEKCLMKDLLRPNDSSWCKRGRRGRRDESREKRLRRGMENDGKGRAFYGGRRGRLPGRA